MSSPRAGSSHDVEPRATRRKVRKGTHSCWECKRRKMKCVFDPRNPAICKGCCRRGCKCISQEFPEENRGSITPAEDARSAYGSILTPSSTVTEQSRPLTFYEASEKHYTKESLVLPGQYPIDKSPLSSKLERLSLFLHKALPSREQMQEICKSNRCPSVLPHQLSTLPYATLDTQGLKSPESLLDIPGSDAHPVLLARYMIKVVTFIQHLQPEYLQSTEGLTESPRAIMERLADLATGLVTTNNELIGSIEGLECIIIESVYLVNIGSLRRSWVSCRRAMGIAQLMGLHRENHEARYKVLDPKTEYDPKIMWFRILDLDRHLCLMLGLPQGCLDRSMASESMLANDTAMGRLERIHCVIASRILERNESGAASGNLALTRTLDVEMQRAARSLPSKWWLTPSLGVASNDPLATFWDTRRLYAQVLHYNLLNQLHLPYMLRSSPADRTLEYSRITCTNASREVLSRFLILRSFNRIAYCCRLLDFVALMAAMTLLLAHLHSQVPEEENLLAHQYASDRAMIEQVQESMSEMNRLNSDSLSAQSSDLLRRLLAIEIEAADGRQCGPGRVSVVRPGHEAAMPEQSDDAVVSVHIPYFGIVKIAREGVRKEEPNSHSKHDNGQAAGSVEMISGILPNPVNFVADYQIESSETVFQGGEYFPELAAGGEDWAFQGVDTAFFENVMRSAVHENTDWTTSARSPRPTSAGIGMSG